MHINCTEQYLWGLIRLTLVSTIILEPVKQHIILTLSLHTSVLSGQVCHDHIAASSDILIQYVRILQYSLSWDDRALANSWKAFPSSPCPTAIIARLFSAITWQWMRYTCTQTITWVCTCVCVCVCVCVCTMLFTQLVVHYLQFIK